VGVTFLKSSRVGFGSIVGYGGWVGRGKDSQVSGVGGAKGRVESLFSRQKGRGPGVPLFSAGEKGNIAS
jgi:hypothetical protein